MKVVTIIQARMGSTRLPGKVLEDIGGASMLERVVERARRSRLVATTFVATTTEPRDDVIVSACDALGLPLFRGAEEDVLDRYYRAAERHAAEAIVRITSDCPLLDPEVMDRVVGSFLDGRPDYASNFLERTYPRGLETEILTMEALETAWREATEAPDRVHVTPYLYRHPDRFRLLSVTGEADESRYRWTVDTMEDLDLVREVYHRLGADPEFTWRDVLRLMREDPELARRNAHVEPKRIEEG